MGTTMVVTTRITHRYLMGKSKDELASWILRNCDEQERLIEESLKIFKSIDAACKSDYYLLPISVEDDVIKFIERYTKADT